jgi:tetratricopeptide (TPR) repeat protein
MAGRAGDSARARALSDEAKATYESLGRPKDAVRASMKLLRYRMYAADRDEAIAEAEQAFEALAGEEPDENMATLAFMLSRAYWFNGDLDRAAERADVALDIAEPNMYPRALSSALRAKGAVAFSRGHLQEAGALQRRSLDIALEHDLSEEAATAYFILSDTAFRRDRFEAALEYLNEALALARRLGMRPFEWGTLAEMSYPLFMLGRWDEALATLGNPAVEQTQAGGVLLSLLTGPLEIHLQRGDLAAAEELFGLFSHLEKSTDMQDRSCYLAARASLSAANGDPEQALRDAEGAIAAAQSLGFAQQTEKQAMPVGVGAALLLGNTEKARAFLSKYDDAPPAMRSPFLEAQAHRFRARLDDAPDGYDTAVAILREYKLPFFLAVTLLEQGEQLDEAREIFERLQARPWLERLQAEPSIA